MGQFHLSFRMILLRKNIMVIPKILVVAALAISAINADRIFRIEIRTADCDDCGMSNTFGDLRMQICNGYKECCNTAELDNTFHNDFEEGALDIFDDHDILTQCDQFDMKNSAASQIIMYLVHEGSDGYQADYIKVDTDTGYYQCNYMKFLDGDDSEEGFEVDWSWGLSNHVVG